MENVDYYDISRHGNDVVITFFNIVHEGEEFTFPVEDAWKILHALKHALSS